MQLSVIIPVLNEESTIENIVKRVARERDVYEIVVVNDGSTDNTLKILNKLKKAKRYQDLLKVFNHKTNLGKGSAIKTGVAKVKGDFVIIQDADLEYDPEEYGTLKKLVNNKNVVYGSRLLGKNRHAYLSTYLGNIVITSFCNLIFGSNLTDSYTCFKLIPSKIAKKLNLTSTGFEIEAEITAKLLKGKVKIIEVPIKYHPRSYEKGKKIKAKDAILGALMFLRIRFYGN